MKDKYTRIHAGLIRWDGWTTSELTEVGQLTDYIWRILRIHPLDRRLLLYKNDLPVVREPLTRFEREHLYVTTGISGHAKCFFDYYTNCMELLSNHRGVKVKCRFSHRIGISGILT